LKIFKKDQNDQPKKHSQDDYSIKRSLTWIPWAVFLFSISVVLLTLVSVVFPALIASSDSTIEELKSIGVELFEVEPFQVGVWAAPLIIVNIFVFISLFLYFKKNLPQSFRKLVDFIFRFEIPKKVAFVVIVVILAIYVGFSWQELTIQEEWEDYPGVKQRLDRWSPEQITSGFEPHVKYFLHWASMVLFGNYSVVPFIASISLLLLTYFFYCSNFQKKICRNCIYDSFAAKQFVFDL